MLYTHNVKFVVIIKLFNTLQYLKGFLQKHDFISSTPKQRLETGGAVIIIPIFKMKKLKLRKVM